MLGFKEGYCSSPLEHSLASRLLTAPTHMPEPSSFSDGKIHRKQYASGQGRFTLTEFHLMGKEDNPVDFWDSLIQLFRSRQFKLSCWIHIRGPSYGIGKQQLGNMGNMIGVAKLEEFLGSTNGE